MPQNPSRLTSSLCPSRCLNDTIFYTCTFCSSLCVPVCTHAHYSCLRKPRFPPSRGEGAANCYNLYMYTYIVILVKITLSVYIPTHTCHLRCFFTNAFITLIKNSLTHYQDCAFRTAFVSEMNSPLGLFLHPPQARDSLPALRRHILMWCCFFASAAAALAGHFATCMRLYIAVLCGFSRRAFCCWCWTPLELSGMRACRFGRFPRAFVFTSIHLEGAEMSIPPVCCKSVLQHSSKIPNYPRRYHQYCHQLLYW